MSRDLVTSITIGTPSNSCASYGVTQSALDQELAAYQNKSEVVKFSLNGSELTITTNNTCKNADGTSDVKKEVYVSQ